MKDQSVSRKVELDSASLFGEPAVDERSPNFSKEEMFVTLRGSVLKRWRRQEGGWRWNGLKVVYVKWGYLHVSRLAFKVIVPRRARHAGVRAPIRAMTSGNADRAKGCREMDTKWPVKLKAN